MGKEKKYYKVFNNDLYEVDKEYKIEENRRLEKYQTGYYIFDNINILLEHYFYQEHYLIVCEVIPLGEIQRVDEKYVTDHIKIIKKLTIREIIELDETCEWSYRKVCQMIKDDLI